MLRYDIANKHHPITDLAGFNNMNLVSEVRSRSYSLLMDNVTH
jgi:hypothetical protein